MTTARPAPPPVRTLTLAQARRTAVAAQLLDRPRPARVTMGHVRRTVERVGLLQIDSVNVLARAHLLPLLARLGPYDRALVDRAAARAPRRLVEYWAHEASYVPPETYQLLRWRMERHRQRSHWGRAADHHPGLLEAVRDAVAETGPVTASALHDLLGHRRGPAESWGWNWTPAKRALEHLFDIGEIAVAGRTAQFERAYDLTARVLPAAVLARPVPAEADAIREIVAISARALGVASVRDLADYFRLHVAPTARAVGELVDEGVLLPAAVTGRAGPAYLHRDARVPRATPARALLAPFDPLVFFRQRVADLWGMRYRIGIYTPAHERTHGYYVLPFLLGEHLVARVDLKSDRAAGVLRVRAAHAEEPGPDDAARRSWPGRSAVVGHLLAELSATAAWLGVDGVVVDADATGDLAADLRTRRPLGTGSAAGATG